MFRRLQSIQSPVNANRQGHRVHVGPDINLYTADGRATATTFYGPLPGFYELTATPYGTYSLNDSQNLLYPDNIINHTGIATVHESDSNNLLGPFQIGINWYSAQLQPDHLYSHYILTIERKTFNQGKNVDIGVTQNVVQGPSTIASNNPSGYAHPAWEALTWENIRDGAEPSFSVARTQSNRYIHNFSNVDLIDQGFLYYCVLGYPDWDGSYHGPYGLNGFEKIFRSWIWTIEDGLNEEDEDFYIRLRGIKKDTNFAPEGEPTKNNIFGNSNWSGSLNNSVAQFPDFITNQDQSRIPESVIISETILRIAGAATTYTPVGIHTLYNSQYSGVIGLSPNIDAEWMSSPTNQIRGATRTTPPGFEEFFEGRPGSSGWDYPQMIWAPLVSESYVSNQFDNPDNSFMSFGMTTETAGVNSPIGPFCGYYTGLTFISTYSANELRTAGLTTGSLIQGITYDVVQAANYSGNYGSLKRPVNPFLSIVNVDSYEQNNKSILYRDFTNGNLVIKGHNRSFPRINGHDFVLGMNAYDPYDAGTTSTQYGLKRLFKEFDNLGPQRISVGGNTYRSAQDKYIWNGQDSIAIISSYEYQYDCEQSTNPFKPSNHMIGGEYNQQDLLFNANTPALVRMAKTYLNGYDGGGSEAYIFDDGVSSDENFFSASAYDEYLESSTTIERSFETAQQTGIGRHFDFGVSNINHNPSTNTWVNKAAAHYNIFARPVIQLDWINVNPNPVLDFNVQYYIETGSYSIDWTHSPTLEVWLQKNTNQDLSNHIGPLPVTYVNSAGITTTETSITGVGQTSDSSYVKSDASVDLSDYVGTGAIRVMFRAKYTRANLQDQNVTTRPIRIRDIYLRAPIDFVNRSYYHENNWVSQGYSGYKGIYVSGDDPTDHNTFNKFMLFGIDDFYPDSYPGETLQEWLVGRWTGYGYMPSRFNLFDVPYSSGQEASVGNSRWRSYSYSNNIHLELQSGTESSTIATSSNIHADYVVHKETFTI